jgi:NAD(P)-dependent dehydrogenase (short-subunit alcohol dehydrogenase family)
MSELASRVALVTGSSRGIGAAIASRFARAGASVALHGRGRGGVGEGCVRDIESVGGRAIAVVADTLPI